MSLDMSVHLDHPDAPVEVGRAVRGHVDLTSDTGIEVRRVTLEVSWRTEGSGNPTSGTTAELDLLPAPTRLRRGETRQIRFIAERRLGRVALWAPLEVAPGCPCSFRARSNRLDWRWRSGSASPAGRTGSWSSRS